MNAKYRHRLATFAEWKRPLGFTASSMRMATWGYFYNQIENIIVCHRCQEAIQDPHINTHHVTCTGTGSNTLGSNDVLTSVPGTSSTKQAMSSDVRVECSKRDVVDGVVQMDTGTAASSSYGACSSMQSAALVASPILSSSTPPVHFDELDDAGTNAADRDKLIATCVRKAKREQARKSRQERHRQLVSETEDKIMQQSQTLKAQEELVRSLQDENSRYAEQHSCRVCLLKEISTVLTPCGHVCCCDDCAPQMYTCPVCRAPVKAITRIYFP